MLRLENFSHKTNATGNIDINFQLRTDGSEEMDKFYNYLRKLIESYKEKQEDVLICGRYPERLGIVDKEGKWDTYKFLQHCEECKICQNFMQAFCDHIDRQLRIEYLVKNVGSPSVSIH